MSAITSLVKRLYYNYYIPKRIKQIRRQKKIVVAFELSNLWTWNVKGCILN